MIFHYFYVNLKENSFTNNFYNTIGVDFKIKPLNVDGSNVKLQIVNKIKFHL
jgi:hypothetical protein